MNRTRQQRFEAGEEGFEVIHEHTTAEYSVMYKGKPYQVLFKDYGNFEEEQINDSTGDITASLFGQEILDFVIGYRGAKSKGGI